MPTHTQPHIPLVCHLDVLTPDEQKHRQALATWLQNHTEDVQEDAAGYALRLAADESTCQEVMAFVLLERQCCPFLRFTIALEPGQSALWLHLGGGEGVKAFLAQAGLCGCA